MSSYILTIKGDTNDANYITQNCAINDDDTIDVPELTDSNGGVYRTVTGHTELSFIEALAKVLKMPRETRHNWTRDEYDSNDHPVRETIVMFAQELYHIDIRSLDIGSGDIYTNNPTEYYDASHTTLKEYVEEYLPYGEFGIHTIDSISYCPETQRTVLL